MHYQTEIFSSVIHPPSLICLVSSYILEGYGSDIESKIDVEFVTIATSVTPNVKTSCLLFINKMTTQQGVNKLRRKYHNTDMCINPFTNNSDHRCGLGVTSLLLTQRARVRSPVGSITWLSFFRGFSSTIRKMSGNLGYIRPRLSYGHHISSVYGRRPSRRSLTLATVNGRS